MEADFDGVLIVGREGIKVKVIQRALIQHSPVLAKILTSQNQGNETIDLDEDGYPTFDFQEFDPVIFPILSLLLQCMQRRVAETEGPISWPQDLTWTSGLLRLYDLANHLKIKVLKCVNDGLGLIVMNREGQVNEDTACRIFQEARESQFFPLAQKALDIILRHPGIIFAKEENYKMLTAESLQEIVSHDDLQVQNEMQIFSIVKTWGELKRLETKGPEENGAHLKEIVSFIPLDQMTETEIKNEEMTTEEQRQIFHFIHPKGSHPRNYYRPLDKLPSEMLSEILSHLSRRDVKSCLLASPNFQRGLRRREELKSISIKTEQSLIEIGSQLRPNSHGYNQIILMVRKLSTFPVQALLNVIESSKYRMQMTLVVHIKVLDPKNLTSFVSLFNLLGEEFVTVEELTIQKIVGCPSLSFGSHFRKIPSLRSITIPCFQESDIDLIQDLLGHCPNLTRISLGLYHCPVGPQLDTFLKGLHARQVDLSWLFPLSLTSPESASDLWSDLKEKRISIKKIRIGQLQREKKISQEFLVTFGDDLEEISGLTSQNLKWISSVGLKFPNLKVLRVDCKVEYLVEALESFPGLEKLFWIYSTKENQQICDQLEALDLSSPVCPTLKILRLRINLKCRDLSVIFSEITNFFPNLEEMELSPGRWNSSILNGISNSLEVNFNGHSKKMWSSDESTESSKESENSSFSDEKQLEMNFDLERVPLGHEN